jgi:arylsulfatase A-like enzyme
MDEVSTIESEPKSPSNRQTPEEDPLSDRRTFLKRGLAGAGSFALSDGLASRPREPRHRRLHGRVAQSTKPPNILVILVDQLREPIDAQARTLQAQAMPNLLGLRRRSVHFTHHYTAANDCSPSRSALLTGLYTHQTGCMITGRSKLNPGFPTWGTLLREIGYDTTWWGKWHLNPNPNASLAQYGFGGGTYPSPNGSPGQGTRVDPQIASQFAEWFAERSEETPWCSTVSFVNPHDVAWWYRFTSRIPQESVPRALVNTLPVNYETPQQMEVQGKPAVQRSLQDTAARSFGAVPFEGPEVVAVWSSLMNTYLMLQSYVDRQIAAVLQTLASRPAMAANTVIVFTSDHGEYGGAHGLRGKGAGAYEEAIRVPLYVCDPRSVLTGAEGVTRSQLTSSVDVVGLLLSAATGSESWRQDPAYAHLATRHDLAGICSNPRAPGRAWVLHATDEDVTEFANDPYAADAPRHVVALRTPTAKLGLYSDWQPGGIEIAPSGQEAELYDYSTPSGQAELENVSGSSALEDELYGMLIEEAIPGELRAELPSNLRLAGEGGLVDYLAVEEYESERAEYAHLPQSLGPEEPTG